MKNIILYLISLVSICFSNVWVSYDLKWDIDELWGDEDVDNGAISIGYETSAKNFSLDYADENNVDELNTSHLNFGASIDIIGARRNNISEQGKMTNIFLKYLIPVKKNKNISYFWCSVGYSFPIGHIEDYLEPGTLYGFGLLHTEGFGLYYIVSNLTYQEHAYFDEIGLINKSDIDISRIGLSYHF